LSIIVNKVWEKRDEIKRCARQVNIGRRALISGNVCSALPLSRAIAPSRQLARRVSLLFSVRSGKAVSPRKAGMETGSFEKARANRNMRTKITRYRIGSG
jgi:hypothetical protein